MQEYSEDYLLDKRVRIFQPLNGYRASTDAVILSSLITRIKDGDTVLDVGSGNVGVDESQKTVETVGCGAHV